MTDVAAPCRQITVGTSAHPAFSACDKCLYAKGKARIGILRRGGGLRHLAVRVPLKCDITERIPEIETAHKLLAAPAMSDGFAALWERGRMDLTVEAVVVEPALSELFSEHELQVARRRLEQFGYVG